jgi:pilus assembly protein Flp/PilA
VKRWHGWERAVSMMDNLDQTAGSTVQTLRNLMNRFVRDEQGATAIEYGLILTLIAAACIAGFKALGGTTTTGWNGMANTASTAMSK